MDENNEFWGYHMSADCYECDKDKIKNRDHVSDFSKELVESIDMVAYGEPQIVHFGEGNKEGFTLVQLIETSNICAHFVNETGNVYLDVFSCKDFDPAIVEDVVKKYFSPNMIIKRCVARKQAKYYFPENKITQGKRR